MNVHDKAYDLARAIRESDDFKALKQAQEALDGDADARRMWADFRVQQTELQQKMMRGEMPSEEESKKLERLYEVIRLNPLVSRRMDAERRLMVVLEDVNRIIAGALEGLEG